MKDLSAFVIDMDGVLWHGDTPLPGLQDFFNTLEELELPYVLATNNAMKVATDYVEKLGRFGVSVAAENILTSSEATASYLKHGYPNMTEVYAVGESGLHRALKAKGFTIVSPAEVRAGARPKLVVTALMRESLSYEILAMATLAVNEGAQIVATNADSSYPTELGFMPGAGAVLSVVSTATGASVENGQVIVVGKPNPAMFNEALRRLGSEATKTAMIGDRLNTDIQGAKKADMQTILLLSGVSKREDITTSGVTPDYVLEDIRALAKALLNR